MNGCWDSWFQTLKNGSDTGRCQRGANLYYYAAADFYVEAGSDYVSDRQNQTFAGFDRSQTGWIWFVR